MIKCDRCGREISKDDSYKYEGQTLCKECFANDEKITAMRDEATGQTLQKLLPLNDTISLVVTGHLLVEYWLDQLIKLRTPYPKKLFKSARLQFSQKLYLAESLGLLIDEYSKGIRILNNIRNHLSHDLEYQISKEELSALQASVSFLSSEDQSTVDKLDSPKEELIFFCISFAGYARGYALGYARSIKKRRRD
jgi:hypothetical protein